MNKPELGVSHVDRLSSVEDTTGATAAVNERTPLTPSLHTTNNQRQSPPVFRRLAEFLAHRWAECVLSVIIVSASLLSLVWVFTVPILQNPDENSHIDYAFTIYSTGRLLNVRRPPSEWNVHARLIEGPGDATYDFISHQYTLYLIDSTDFMRIRFHPEERVPPGYGTASYYQNLDRNAPHAPAQIHYLRPQDNPWLVTGYPFAYYAAVAIWLKLTSLFSSGPVGLFFAARIVSVFLLAWSLAFTYAILRELRLSKLRSLALTAIAAFFPVTTFISSSVQPDNLAWALMSLCFYLALLLRRKPANYRLLALLGTALGLLLVTKYHFYLFTVVAIIATVVTEHFFRRSSWKSLVSVLTALLLPSVLLFAVQLWVVWGAPSITGSNLRFAASGHLDGVKKALQNYYRGGPALLSYWGIYGWMDTPLIIGSPIMQRRILLLLSGLTLLVFLLVLFRWEQVITRLVVLARHGRWRMALRILFSNPLLHSHFIFSAFMILLFAWHEKGFGAQGRHWFPYFLSGFLITTQFAPRALTHRKTQAAVSAMFILGLMSYCVLGGYYSIQAIKKRYYGPQANAAISSSFVGRAVGSESPDR
jgi:hypothetical protein